MAEVKGYVAEVDQGSEIQFCPILQQPIIRSQRVRSLPGFHLLSLGAGREALARGYYEAFGQRFSCTELEYLHPDDKVFICVEDHKAFKNRMSMQYHRYIRHELEERKLERKRMRERAAERQERSLAHAARQQQLQQAPPLPALTAGSSAGREADPRTVSTSSVAPPAAITAGAEATNDPYGDSAESGVTHDPYAVEDGEPPSDAPVPVAVPISTASTTVASSKPPALAPPPVAVAQPKQEAEVKAPVKAPATDDDDDLYGDMGGPEVKKQKTASTYASAIGAMMTDDFDEDE